jgi:hypothetical protein
MKNTPVRPHPETTADADDTRAALERLETETAAHQARRAEGVRRKPATPSRRVVPDRDDQPGLPLSSHTWGRGLLQVTRSGANHAN